MPRKKTTNKELTKKETGVLSKEFLETEYTGFENVDRESLSIPFLKIAQNNSTQVNEDDPSYIKGLKPGYFFNSMLSKNYGKKLKVILLDYYRLYIEWGASLGEFIGAYFPEEFEKMKKNLTQDGVRYYRNENQIMDTRNFFILLPDFIEDGIMIFPLKSTSIKYVRKWLSKATIIKIPNTTQQAPLFSRVWEITTTQVQNEKGRWYQIGEDSTVLSKDLGFIPGELEKHVLAAIHTVKTSFNNVTNINYSDIDEQDNEIDSDEF